MDPQALTPIDQLFRVEEIYEFVFAHADQHHGQIAATTLITPALNAGRRNEFNVIMISHRAGTVTPIAREVDMRHARKIAKTKPAENGWVLR